MNKNYLILMFCLIENKGPLHLCRSVRHKPLCLIHYWAHWSFGAALFSNMVLCFLCEPEQGVHLCYLVESTGFCLQQSLDMQDCFYR